MARYERDFGYGRGRGFGGRYDTSFRDDRFGRFQAGGAGWRGYARGYDQEFGRRWQGQSFPRGYDQQFRRPRYGDDFRSRQGGGPGREQHFGWGEGPGGFTPGRPAGLNAGYGGYNRNLMYGDVYRSEFGY